MCDARSTFAASKTGPNAVGRAPVNARGARCRRRRRWRRARSIGVGRLVVARFRVGRFRVARFRIEEMRPAWIAPRSAIAPSDLGAGSAGGVRALGSWPAPRRAHGARGSAPGRRAGHAGVVGAFDGLDDVEHAHVVEITGEGVTAGGTGLGAHPSPGHERGHGLGEVARRRAQRIRQLRGLHAPRLGRQGEQGAGREIGPARDLQSHSPRLYDHGMPSHPPGEPPSHPRGAAALLMVGVVVFLILMAVMSSR
jgi:hypothetical protein